MADKKQKILRSLYNGCVEALYDFEKTKKHTFLVIKNNKDLYCKELRKYQKQWLKNSFEKTNLNAKEQKWLLDLATKNKVYKKSWGHCYYTKYRSRLGKA